MEVKRDRVFIERKNLARVCSLSVKTLIDKSCYMTLDDQSEEFLNFCIILEHVFNHQFKPRMTWYRGKDLKGVWDYIKHACKSVPNNCLTNVNNFEHIKTGHGKVRAWVRVALMEKRLSEYISSAISQRHLTSNFYGKGALLLSEEADLLTKSLLGLNAIDFSFDLKSGDFDPPGCTAIDYSPYLHFTQCPQSIVEDARELRSLSFTSRDESPDSEPKEDQEGSEHSVGSGYPTNSLTMENTPDVNDCEGGFVSDDYRVLVQQKGYLEELLRLRESQLSAERREKSKLSVQLAKVEGEKARDIHQLETVIIELQAQLQTLKNDYHRLQRHVYMTSRVNKQQSPGFRYSARDQRMSVSSDSSSHAPTTFIPTAEEAATLLPDSPETSPTRTSGNLPEESPNESTTLNVQAEVHQTSNNENDEVPIDHANSPIADLLTTGKAYYNLGADVDRESSEERTLSSDERHHEIRHNVPESLEERHQEVLQNGPGGVEEMHQDILNDVKGSGSVDETVENLASNVMNGIAEEEVDDTSEQFENAEDLPDDENYESTDENANEHDSLSAGDCKNEK